MALLLAAPAFAQSRGDWNRNDSNRGAQATQTQTRADSRFNNNNSYRNNNTYRDNNNYRGDQHYTATRERDSYRTERSYDRSYGGREYRDRDRDRGVRFGLSVNFGVPVVGYGYDNALIRGVVDNVDYRTGTVWLRDDASGQEIRAAVGGSYALDTLHRGELVQLTGQWTPGGVFGVASIANLSY